MWGQERDIGTGCKLTIVDHLPISLYFSMGCAL
jgi:hypothetical protein